MYLRYYGLEEPPFSISPDPRFVHLSERHRDALAHLLFGIDKGGGGGFVQLTGEVGTGKTTLSRLLLEQLPDNVRLALVLNPRQEPVELLETICEEFKIDTAGRRGSSKALIDALNAYLLDAYGRGLRAVVLIDEAQNLPAGTLEQLRLLTNLETNTQKLLQILLLGQPELRELLARPGLRQLAQRITARFHLTPLDATESDAYLRHRWRVAGGGRFPFDAAAVRRLHARSGGVPRLLNVIAERALLAGYARDASGIDRRLVDTAADEIRPRVRHRRNALPLGKGLAAAAIAVAIVMVAIAMGWRAGRGPATLAPAPIAAASAETPLGNAGAPGQAPARAGRMDAATLARVVASDAAGNAAAWSRLLALWSLPAAAIASDGDAGCRPAAERADVHCVQGRARLDALVALDRPVLLHLGDDTARGWVLLVGADARTARLDVGGRLVDIDRAALLAVWRGDYASVWRGPAELSPPPRPGSSGAAVDWLREQVGSTSPPGSPYDAALRDAVRAQQAARGLPADGIAGPLTLMALGNALPGPHLQRVLH